MVADVAPLVALAEVQAAVETRGERYASITEHGNASDVTALPKLQSKIRSLTINLARRCVTLRLG